MPSKGEYEARKAAGQCTNCGGRPAAPGRTRCPACQQEAAKRPRRLAANKASPPARARSTKRRSRRVDWVRAKLRAKYRRLCVKCGGPLAEERYYCAACVEKRRVPKAAQAAALLFLLLPALAQARVWTVSHGAACPGDGSPDKPFCRLIQIQAVAQCGDVVRLKASSTPYPAAVLKRPSCEGKAPLVIEGALNEEPIWLGGLRIEDMSNVVVRGQTWRGGQGVALLVKARGRPVHDVQLLGNRVLDWHLAPTGQAQAAILLEGTGGQVFTPVVGALVRGNEVRNFRGRGIHVVLSQGERVEYNVIAEGRCARRQTETEALDTGVLIGVNLTGWSYEAPVAVFGGTYQGNTITDLQGVEACRTELGLVMAAVHGVYCDVGPSDVVVRDNVLLRIGQGGGRWNTYGIRMEARCHRALVQANRLEDVGGSALRVNGPNFGVRLLDNIVKRAGNWCVEVQEGFVNPLRPGLRREVRGTQCLESLQGLFVSPEARLEDPGFIEADNQWPQ